MSIDLRDATLDQMVAELRRRAKRTCDRCGGFGVLGATDAERGGFSASRRASRTSDFGRACPRCRGAGYEDDPKLLALAERLEQLSRAVYRALSRGVYDDD